MIKKKKLTVSPKHKVYQAKYPSYMDKNPLLHPETRPYPFSKKFIDAMSIAGFTGAIMIAPLTGCQSSVKQIPSDHFNPFPISTTNVPFTPASFGTGLPSRINSKDAIDFINNVFISEGLAIHKDTVIRQNGLAVTATAYNEQYGIGYIWMDNTNFGEGMIMTPFYERKKRLNQVEMEAHCLERIDGKYKQYQNNPESFYKNYFGKKDSLKNNFIADLSHLTNEEERENFFFETLKKTNLERSLVSLKKGKTLEEIKQWKIRAADYFDTPNASLAFLYRMRNIDIYLRMDNAGIKEAIQREVQQINAIEDNKIWKERTEILLDLINVSQNFYMIKYQPEYCPLVVDILNHYEWQARASQFHRLEQLINDIEISYQEATTLANAQNKDDLFIAPISQRDNRTVYRTEPAYFRAESEYNAKAQQLNRQMNQATTQKEKKRIERLQEDLRIEWRIKILKEKNE